MLLSLKSGKSDETAANKAKKSQPDKKIQKQKWVFSPRRLTAFVSRHEFDFKSNLSLKPLLLHYLSRQ